MKQEHKIIIIGGGASGLAAAGACLRKHGKGSVLLLERQQRTGRKLLATGNGRCNISNTDINPGHYSGNDRIISSVLSSFSVKQMKQFCRRMGLLLREDDGRLYPYSNSAATVLDCLRREIVIRSGTELCGVDIHSVKKNRNGFVIETDSGRFLAQNVIFATGSKAYPASGADDSGYKLLSEMGIEHTPLYPALSPVATKEKFPVLKGVRAKGSVSLYADGNLLGTQNGEIQFSEKGISGICVFQLSGMINEYLYYGTVSGKKIRNMTISADVMPEFSEQELCSYLRTARQLFDTQSSREILSAALNRKLSEALMKSSGIRAEKACDLSEKDLEMLAYHIKHFNFTPTFSDSFKTSQVCAGGINSTQIDPATLMSRKYDNLYICGELLDVYGECGGYNLHFAVGSALLAARNIR